MAYLSTPSFSFGKSILEKKAKDMKEIQEQIEKAKQNIEKLKVAKKDHSEPAYKNMSKKDIKFFDKQYDELIKFYKKAIKVYEIQYAKLEMYFK